MWVTFFVANIALIAINLHHHHHNCLPPPPPPRQLDILLAKVGDWGYDTLALEEATSGHALSVLGFMLVTRTEVFKKFRLDKGRLARCERARAAGDGSMRVACVAFHGGDGGGVCMWCVASRRIVSV